MSSIRLFTCLSICFASTAAKAQATHQVLRLSEANPKHDVTCQVTINGAASATSVFHANMVAPVPDGSYADGDTLTVECTTSLASPEWTLDLTSFKVGMPAPAPFKAPRSDGTTVYLMQVPTPIVASAPLRGTINAADASSVLLSKAKTVRVTTNDGYRALNLDSTVPSAVEEVATLIAEAIYEQGQSGAYSALSLRMERLFCDKLGGAGKDNGVISGQLKARLGLDDGELAFPNTCNVVKSTPLPGLVTTSDLFVNALATDMLLIGFGAVEQAAKASGGSGLTSRGDAHVENLLARITPILIDRIRSGQEPDATDAQLLLAAIVEEDWTIKLGTDDPERLDCSIGLAVTAAAWCVGNEGKCNVGMLSDLLSPDATGVGGPEVNLGETCEALLTKGTPEATWLTRHKTQLSAIALDLLALVNAREDEANENLHRAVELPFKITDLALDAALDQAKRADTKSEEPDANATPEEPDANGTPEAQPQLTLDKIRRTRTLLEPIRALSLAIVDGQHAQAVTAGGVFLTELVDVNDCSSGTPVLDSDGEPKMSKGGNEKTGGQTDCRKAVRKVAQAVPFATVLASAAEQAQEPNPDETAEEAAARHDANKEALKAAMKAATQRAGREGNAIFSLGSPLGFAMHGTLYSDTTRDLTFVQGANLTLPFGLGLQSLAKGRTGHGLGKTIGLHAALYPFDLAEFVNKNPDDEGGSDPVVWSDFVEIGGQVGILFNVGGPANSFVLAGDLRYDPVGDDQFDLRAGLVLAYYVPFFDFN